MALSRTVCLSALLAIVAPVLANETYIVVSGDTACEIAEEFSISCASLIEANQLGPDGLIFVGQSLSVPQTTNEQNNGLSVAPKSGPPAEPKKVQSPEEAPVAANQEIAQPNKPAVGAKVDLLSIYTAALENDPVLSAQAARRDAARQAVPRARSEVRPQLSFDSNLTRSYDDDFDESDSLRTSVSLNQSIYSPTASISLRQARYQISAADVDYQEAEQDLILRVARGYFTALKMADNLVLSEKNQEALGRQLELARQRLEAGLGTQTALFEAEARYEGSVADGIEAAKLLDDANQGLIMLTGRNPKPLRKLRAKDYLTPPTPNEPGPWIDAALKNNNKLIAEKHSLSVLKLEAEKKRAARLPSLGASLTSSFNDTETKNTMQTTFALRLSVPILKGGLMRSQIREADFNLRAAYSNYESSRRQTQIQARGTFLAISTSLRRIESLSGAVRSSKSALRAKEEGLAAGLNTNTDVLDGQRDLFLAEFNYLKERYDCVIKTLELQALVGNLTVDDVRRVNAWLR